MDEEEFEPTRWRQVRDPDGELWYETSSESDARREMRPGDTLHRLYQKVTVVNEWREEK